MLKFILPNVQCSLGTQQRMQHIPFLLHCITVFNTNENSNG